MDQSKRYSPRQRRQSRRVLLQALYQWDIAKPNLATIRDLIADQGSLENADAVFFEECFIGILEQSKELDSSLEPFLDRSLAELTFIERVCLRAGCFEVTFREDVPNNVAISEWVHLAKVFGAQNSFRYINAVLDAVAKKLSVPDHE